MFADLLRKLNSLEETINDRHRQLNGATEQRREFDRLMTKLTDWIKSTEQQIKDPFANDLQQNATGMKEKYRSIQVRIESLDRTSSTMFYFSCFFFIVINSIYT